MSAPANDEMNSDSLYGPVELSAASGGQLLVTNPVFGWDFRSGAQPVFRKLLLFQVPQMSVDLRNIIRIQVSVDSSYYVPSGDAKNHSAIQELTRHLCNLKPHYCVHGSQPLILILYQTDISHSPDIFL